MNRQQYVSELNNLNMAAGASACLQVISTVHSSAGGQRYVSKLNNINFNWPQARHLHGQASNKAKTSKNELGKQSM